MSDEAIQKLRELGDDVRALRIDVTDLAKAVKSGAVQLTDAELAALKAAKATADKMVADMNDWIAEGEMTP